MKTTIGILLFLVSSSLFAANRSCNSTLVTQNICRDSGNLVLYYDAPLSAFIELRDALLDEYNYQTEIVCAPTRQYTPLLNGQNSKMLSAAGVAQSDCTTVGQPATNPQSSGDFADAAIDYEQRNRVIAYKFNLAQEQAGDPTTIPTPDVGQ